MYIQPETLELIRSRVVIQDVIRRYVPSLKKKGKNYLGLCPFHKEKTASFTVSPDKQIFYCFGCHTGGNIFNFIGKMERLEFPESVRFVADMVGVELGDDKREDTAINEALYHLNKMAMEQFRACINSPAGKKGLDYIISRGITAESIERFGIGFAPDSWDFLTRSIIKSKRDAGLAESIGLIRTSQNRANSYYDNFRNRVMFPIFGIAGNVIAFGGRTIGDDTRKYINSSESAIFKKRSMLYGLNLARESIKDLDRAIVVEGYLDVIGCHQAGLDNVVAPLGTAMTDEQIKMLGHYCNEIIFMYDADTAGMKAAIRSLDITEETNINVRIGMLPEDDPFDYIMKKGPREFMAVVDRAVIPVEFRIDRIMDNYPVLGRVNTLLNLFSVIRELKLETERSVYLKKISTLLEVDENSVRADFKNYLLKQHLPKNENTQIAKNEQSDFLTRSYRDITRFVCQSPKLIEKVVIDYPISDIPDAVSREILKKISELYYNDPEFTIDKIFDFFQNGREMDFLNEVVNVEHSVINPDAAYTEIYINMKVREIDDKIDKYHALLKSSAGENANMYLTEIEVLRREKEKMLHYVYNKVS